MAEYTGRWDEVENELAEIAAGLTALGDMIPGLFLNIEDIEPETPKGIKFLLGAPYPRSKLTGYTGAPVRPFGATAKITRPRTINNSRNI
jgi:hypothetical protein